MQSRASATLAAYFKLQALPMHVLLLLTGIPIGDALVTTMMKHRHARRFGWQ